MQLLRLPQILLVLLLAASTVVAAPIEITKKNLRQFALLSGRDHFACHKRRTPPVLGTIDSTRLRSGTTWRPASAAKVTEKIARLQRELDELGRLNPTKKIRARIKSKTESLAAAEQSLMQIDYYKQRCLDLATLSEFTGSATSLAQYHETLSRAEIRSLLDKVAFGGSPELEEIGRLQGLSALVDALVDGIPDTHQVESQAQYWENKELFTPNEKPNLRVWNAYAAEVGQIYRFIYSPNPFHEWMLLALSAHFATNLDGINFSFNEYYHLGIPAHIALLRAHVTGNFADLAKGMLTDSAMNHWLDNKDNEAGNPNQNFARELLELFLLGAIDPITKMSNYGQDSIVASTGYVSGYYETAVLDSGSGEMVGAIDYDTGRHDTTSRTVFAGVSGAEATAAYSPEGFIDHVLQDHNGSARYIAERFAGQLLYPGLPESIVDTLAILLRQNNYELAPFLKTILKSEAMFSTAAQRPCVASPVETIIHLMRRLLRTPLPTQGDPADFSNYFLYKTVDWMRTTGQLPFEPPSVFGWKGACNINRAGATAAGEGWISAQKLLNRSRQCIDFMNTLTDLAIDPRETLQIFTSMSADQLIDHIADEVFDVKLTNEQRQVLVTFLRTDSDGQGNRVPVKLQIGNRDYALRKIPRLICLIGDLIDANAR